MKGKLKSWIFGIVIVAILILPIMVDYYGNKNVEILTYSGYEKLLAKEGFSVVHFGDTSNENFENTKETLISMKDTFKDIQVKSVDQTKLSETDKSKLIAINELLDSETSWILIEDGQIEYVHQGDITNTELEKQINKYYNDIIPSDEIAYLTAKDYKTYKKAIDANKIVMTVFGRTTCSWCNKFKPVFNDLALEHKLNIYYFDSDIYNEEEYQKVMNMNIKIPGTCTESGTAQPLSNGFGTPLTIFTKKGKVIGCISGFRDKENLTAEMKSVGMIK